MYVFTGSSMAGLAVSFGCMVFAMSFGTIVSTYILPRATTHTVPGWSLVLDWCMCLHCMCCIVAVYCPTAMLFAVCAARRSMNLQIELF